jgi:hypothetical protein
MSAASTITSSRLPRDRWSYNPLEGNVPNLLWTWKFHKKPSVCTPDLEAEELGNMISFRQTQSTSALSAILEEDSDSIKSVSTTVSTSNRGKLLSATSLPSTSSNSTNNRTKLNLQSLPSRPSSTSNATDPSSSTRHSNKETINAHTNNDSNSTIFSASKKLYRQIRLSELALQQEFSELEVDFQFNSGMKCPNLSCPVQRPRTISEIHQGWQLHQSNSNSNMGDSNRYTSKCIYCNVDFTPRFCVSANKINLLPKEDNVGANNTANESVTSNILWCEYLSPWTLHKEVLNITFDCGISEILSKKFRNESHQRAVLFWNLIVAFRLRGLPYTVLLTDRSIVHAFPPK